METLEPLWIRHWSILLLANAAVPSTSSSFGSYLHCSLSVMLPAGGGSSYQESLWAGFVALPSSGV